MSFDPLLTLLGLTAFATAADPATFAPTAARSAIRIAPAALPSAPGAGDLAIDSGDSNKLKWWNGSAWTAAGGGTPAGSNTYVQYNNAGAFGASADFYWNGSLVVYTNSAKSTAYTAQQAVVFVADAAATGAYSGVFVQVSRGTVTTTSATGIVGANISVSLGGAAAVASTATITAIRGIATSTRSGGSTGEIRGLELQTSNAAGCTVNVLYGAQLSQTFTGPVTDGYGLYVTTSGAGAVTTYYGLRLQLAASAVTTHYGIYQDGTSVLNYFAGNMGVGAAAPLANTALVLPASTTARSSMRITTGAAPSSPVDGDVWYIAASGLWYRRSSTTDQVVYRAGGGSGGAGVIAAWAAASGSLSDATGFSWSTGSGGQYLVFNGATPTVGAGTTICDVYATINGAISTTTSGLRGRLTCAVGGASATAIAAAGHSWMTVSGFGANDTAGARYVGHLNTIDAGPGAFFYTQYSSFLGTLTRVTWASTINNVNPAATALIGSDIELTCTIGGTSGATSIATVAGLRVNPLTFSATSGKTMTITDYYGLYLGTLTTSGAGSFTVSNKYGVYQADTAAQNYWAGNNVFVPKALPTGVTGMVVVDSGDSNKLKWYDGSTWQSALSIQLGVPSAEGADRALTNADNGKNLICSGTRVFTVNTGLASGFGCSIKGTVSFAGTATVTDVRTTGATNPWCALCATGTDTYDVVGSKA